MNSEYQKGFSLIELVIVMAIIGIIAGVALPSYRTYVMKTNRSDGMAILNEIIQAQERWAAGAGNGSYTTTLTNLGYSASPTSPEGYYSVSARTCGGTALTSCVLLTATPVAGGGQQNDNNGNGGALSLNSRGEKVGWK